MPGLGDAPVQPEYVDTMKDIAGLIDNLFNGSAKGDDKKVGFILMVFPFVHDGRCNYMSNANREDVVVMLKEQIKRFEGQAEMSGHA